MAPELPSFMIVLRNAALLALVLSASFVAFACDGTSDQLDRPRSPQESGPPPDPLAEAVKAGPPMMRNLSNREYLSSISVLIGKELPADLTKTWTPTTQFAGFDAIPWTNLDAKALRDRSETLETILDEALASPKVMTCLVSTNDRLAYDACAKQILEPLAARAFGRPLTPAETASLTKSYDQAVTVAKTAVTEPAGIFSDGVRAALGSIFLAPQFLNRLEPPPSPDFTAERPLDAYELASRMSFMFMGAIPDDELWAKAQDGSLQDPAVLAAEANRILETKTEAFVQNFLGQWFDFRSYDSAAPNSLERAMWTESSRTLIDLIRDDKPMIALLKPGFTYVNAELAKHYGIPGDFKAEFERVPTEDRGGILQQGSWLSLSATPLKTSPIHRGRLVQDRFLCKVVPPPDSALFEKIQEVSASIPETATVKQRLEQHRKAGDACFGCHQYMDPIGLGLEGFDQFGKTRTKYADGKTVETQSDILGKPFSTVNELSQLISDMPEYTACASEKLSIYSLRRPVDQKADAELVTYLTNPKDGKPPGIREMIVRLVKSNAFRKVNHGVRN